MKVLAQDNRLEHPTTFQMGAEPVPRDYFFTEESPWRAPVESYTPYQHPTIAAAKSSNWVAELCRQMDLSAVTGLPVPGASTSKAWVGFSAPMYVIPAGYPRRPVSLDDLGMALTAGKPELLNGLLEEGVPAPVDAIPGLAGINDAWMIFYQPSTDTLWEGYRVQRSDPDGPIDTFRWGGVIQRVSEHSGTYMDRYDLRGIQIEGSRWGGAATSITLAAGIPDVEELITAQDAGTAIPHAIPGQIGHCQASPIGYVAPATRGDGDMFNRADVPPEGAKFVFPPGSDFSRVPDEFMPFALAIQEHGWIPKDKTGFGVTMQLRDYTLGGSSGVAPGWIDALPLFQTYGSAASYHYMISLPWHQAVVVAPSA